jgi:hypothetical protein
MMRRPIFALPAVIWALCFAGIVSAADIRRNDHPLYPFTLEGTIVPGDYDRLRKLIDEDCPGKYYNSAGYIACHSKIYLASPGGSVAEAMKIGRLVRTLRWETEIPEDYPPGTPDLRSGIIAATELKDPKKTICARAHAFSFTSPVSNEISSTGKPF